MQIRVSVQRRDEFPFLHELMTSHAKRLRADRITIQDVGEEPAPGEMGATFDVIKLVVESAPAWGTLALVFATWWEGTHRQADDDGPSIIIERADTKITLTGVELSDPAATVARILEALPPGDDGSDPEDAV